MSTNIRRRRRIFRVLMLGMVVTAAVVLLLIARPTIFLMQVSARDRDAPPPIPAGMADDVSRMNETAVHEIIQVADKREAAEAQLAELLQRAASEHLRVSIAGARHTMGGHTIYPGGIVVDMTTFNHFHLDSGANVLHVQSGARWSDILAYLDPLGKSIAVMQSNNTFTVGGSISANCHGWPTHRPPIASTVRSFRLMKAAGSIVTCSPNENSEQFSLALGGYGLFGIILDADLDVVPNELYQMQRDEIAADDLPQVFTDKVINRPDAGMAYARLRVTQERFLEDAVLNVFYPADVSQPIPPLHASPLTNIKRSVFRGSAVNDYGKRLRWNAELALSDRLAEQTVSRNQLLNDPASWYENRTDDTTDIIHEYFIPADSFAQFLASARHIIPRHEGNLLNVTVRHFDMDNDTFLRYADRDMFALVFLFCQPRTSAADAVMQSMTQELIDAALNAGGRYYLPYRLHATVGQFDRAYPQGQQFFELKRKYDPQELFQNEFYTKYGRANPQSE